MKKMSLFCRFFSVAFVFYCISPLTANAFETFVLAQKAPRKSVTLFYMDLILSGFGDAAGQRDDSQGLQFIILKSRATLRAVPRPRGINAVGSFSALLPDGYGTPLFARSRYTPLEDRISLPSDDHLQTSGSSPPGSKTSSDT